jgi:hypothetical protein
LLRLDTRACEVKFDRPSCEQAIVNLAANARDAMPRGGSLVIETAHVELGDPEAQRWRLTPGPHVRLSVSDTGVGMGPDVVVGAFEPFFTTKPRGSGTGLGLSMVYGFVEQSGGHIDLSSQLGSGTTFVIHLPMAVAEAPAEHRPAGMTAAGLGGDETLLLVEDDPHVRTSVRRLLARGGYCVLEADGHERALALAREAGDEVALVITDVLMPGMSGPELAGHLLAIMPRAKLLYISGHTGGQLAALGTFEGPGAQGQRAFLQKPFSQQELQRAVRQLLDS